VLSQATLSQVQKLLPSSKHGSLYAVDLETIGTDASHPDSGVVGIGFANEDECFYIDLRGMEIAALNYLIEFLLNVRLTAFNVLFDGAFLAALTGKWLNWVGCSYGLFKQLSLEGYDGQKWNLETAMVEVLGWPETNKEVLEAILWERGMSKADIGKLEPEVLGPYCASDADAHWQLWHHLQDVIKENDFKFLQDYHDRIFMTEVKVLVESQFRGMAPDLDALNSYRADLDRRIDTSLQSFLSHTLVAPHIGQYNKDVAEAIEAAAPSQFTAKGEESVRWQKWMASKDSRIAARSFNSNSSDQLGWLFYEKVFRVVGEKLKYVLIEVDGKQYEVEKTPGGGKSVNKQILPIFGEPGKMLMQYNKLKKELSYVKAAIAKTQEGGGILRPMYNSIGTVTGRLSGGEADVD